MLSTAPEYERKSMINEMVRRMCSKKASIDHLIADPPPPLLPAAAVIPAIAVVPPAGRSSASYLVPARLSMYVSVFDEWGAEEPGDVESFDEDELIAEFGMKKGHAKRLRKWLAVNK